MYKIKIIAVGKTREPWLDQALEEYLKRLKPNVLIDFFWTKGDDQLLYMAKKEASFVCLDPQGTAYTSENFANFILKMLEEGGSRLTFIIGGPEGLPGELRSKSRALISLSSLTMTHQIIRIVLIEQIYRAFEIIKGSKYHK